MEARVSGVKDLVSSDEEMWATLKIEHLPVNLAKLVFD